MTAETVAAGFRRRPRSIAMEKSADVVCTRRGIMDHDLNVFFIIQLDAYLFFIQNCIRLFRLEFETFYHLMYTALELGSLDETLIGRL